MPVTALIEHARRPLASPPGLRVFRAADVASPFEALVYEPIVCLILQGAKEITVGGERHTVTAGQALVVSHPLPVVSRITEAPYTSLVAAIDLAELRSLHDAVGGGPTAAPSSALTVSLADDALLDVFRRYLELAEDPSAAGVLTPLIRRELHYRLLTARHGAMLRALLVRTSHGSQIAQALDLLRRSFRQPMEVAALARAVGMSPSAFHKHFRSVTSTTPLQYQKDLRLTEARRLLLSGQHTVSTAAFEVGYESASQFSREYTRKFGAPPRLTRPTPGVAQG